MMRFRKGRDPLQQEVWERNKAAMLGILYEHPNEQFTVRGLSNSLALSEPTVRMHLSFFMRAKIVRQDKKQRPAEYGLRPFWPMQDGLIEKLKQTLRYASQDAPPDMIKFTLSENKRTKTEVTILGTGKGYARQYKLSVTDAVGFSDKPNVT